MSEDELAERLQQAQLTPARINPYELPPDQHGWRGVTVSGAAKRKIYTVLHNEQVLVTALLRFPGETGSVGSRHYHDSGELSVRFEGDMVPIVGWSPPGDPHLHGAAPNPGAKLAEVLRRVAEESDPKLETARVATQLGQLLQIPEIAEWVNGLFRPEPRLLVTIDVLFPPFTTYVPDADGGTRKIVGQWYD